MSQSTLCAQCPNRHLANNIRSQGRDIADLIRAMERDESLAQSVIARKETEALEIESKGCGWWWGLNWTNTETLQSEVRWECGVKHLARISIDQTKLIDEALQTANSIREVRHSDMDELICSVKEETKTLAQILTSRLNLIEGLALLAASSDSDTRIKSSLFLTQDQIPGHGNGSDSMESIEPMEPVDG